MSAPTIDVEEMSASLERLFDDIRQTRAAGQAEYARAEANVFANFDRIASLLDLSREEVMMTYAFKHMDGILAHVRGHRSQREAVRGRVIDLMLYLALFVASEEAREGAPIDSYNASFESGTTSGVDPASILGGDAAVTLTYCWLCESLHADACADELHATGWTPAPQGDARDVDT